MSKFFFPNSSKIIPSPGGGVFWKIYTPVLRVSTVDIEIKQSGLGLGVSNTSSQLCTLSFSLFPFSSVINLDLKLLLFYLVNFQRRNLSYRNNPILYL